MPDREPIETRNLDRYGNAPLPWSRAYDLLTAEVPVPDDPQDYRVSYLSTVRRDGRPHSAGIGDQWYDGDLYFTSSPDARKARNLAGNPACTLSTRYPGLDLIFEGEATRVTDPATLETLASLYQAQGWPAEVEGDALTAPFNAPSAGPPPWHLYRLVFHTVFGVASVEPFGATRWRFESRDDELDD